MGDIVGSGAYGEHTDVKQVLGVQLAALTGNRVVGCLVLGLASDLPKTVHTAYDKDGVDPY